MARILVVGLNPAWQKALEFDTLALGQVNRACTKAEFGAGKGLNAARALRRLGNEVSLLQILGGANGRRIEESCRKEGIHSLGVEVAQETRVCTTIVDRSIGQSSELIEPFHIAPEEKVEERVLASLIQHRQRFDALLICGTVPTGMKTEIYLDIHRVVQSPMAILDVYKELPEKLLAVVNFFKINRQEYESLKTSRFMGGDLLSRRPVFLITDGPRPAMLIENEAGRIVRQFFLLPALEEVRNQIGSGDTVTGAFAHFFLQGLNVAEAFREALAVGSASCLSLVPGEFKEEDRRRIAESIVVQSAADEPAS
jgi:tagatose 6-phosphate kinase